MTKSPKVSVVMPVFNGLPYLADAIDSVLAQTVEAFEFIIVDDGSSDGSRDLLEHYAARDRRIRVLRNETNLGIAESLNRGMSQCRGEYIARMDADDVSLPARLQQQVEFMDKSPDVGVCGTWFTTMGEESTTYSHPLSDAQIKAHHLLRDTAICHPTAFVRRSVWSASGVTYRGDEVPAEDLWLWIRLGFVTRLANVPQSLLNYRVHPFQASTRGRASQRARAAAARLFFVERILSRPLTDNDKSAHAALSGQTGIATPAEFDRVRQYAVELTAANAVTRLIDDVALRAALDECLERLPLKYAENHYKYCEKYDLRLLFDSVRDPLRPLSSLPAGDTARFIVKCVVHHIPARRSP
jgi:glycosyltransferase involved in cell wall biosynthesis